MESALMNYKVQCPKHGYLRVLVPSHTASHFSNISIGMAIRMAQDLGMNRSGETWQRNGQNIFTEHQKTIRKRIWASCVKMDK